MNNKKITLTIALVLILILAGAGIIYNRLGQKYDTGQLAVTETAEKGEVIDDDNTSDSASDSTGSETDKSDDPSKEGTSTGNNAADQDPVKAPDFTVYDREGNAFSLSEYAGKPVVLNFWASWCGPCQMEMPAFDEAYEEYGNDMQFMLVNLTDGYRESVDTASQFIDVNGFSFPVFYDTDLNGAMTYGIGSIPATFFIDADGYITAHARGSLDIDTLRQGISMIQR